MSAELISFLESKADFEENQINTVVSCFKRIKVKRKEALVRAGDVAKHFYFVQQGCLRLYEIDSKGNDITAFFALEGDIITTVPSFLNEKPSRDFLVAYEPSEVLAIRREDFYHLVEAIPGFAQVYQKFMEFAYTHAQTRIYSFLGMEGIDKIKWVMAHEPKLLTRVSSKTVASYLGMTNSTLSKLRAKL